MVVRFGLIGCGFISKKHIQALAVCKGAQLDALSDLDEVRIKEAKKYYQEYSSHPQPIKYYQNYKEMLSDRSSTLSLSLPFLDFMRRWLKQFFFLKNTLFLKSQWLCLLESPMNSLHWHKNSKKSL